MFSKHYFPVIPPKKSSWDHFLYCFHVLFFFVHFFFLFLLNIYLYNINENKIKNYAQYKEKGCTVTLLEQCVVQCYWRSWPLKVWQFWRLGVRGSKVQAVLKVEGMWGGCGVYWPSQDTSYKRPWSCRIVFATFGGLVGKSGCGVCVWLGCGDYQ